MEETQLTTLLTDKDRTRRRTHTLNTNNNCDLVTPSRQSSRRSKLPRHYISDCGGLPEWMLRRSTTNPVSTSLTAESTVLSPEIHELGLPSPFPVTETVEARVQALSPDIVPASPIPMRVIRLAKPVRNKTPDTIVIPFAVDAPSGFYDEEKREKKFGCSDLISFIADTLPVEYMDVTPNVLRTEISRITNGFDKIFMDQIKSEPKPSQFVLDSEPKRRGRPRKNCATIAATPSSDPRGRPRRVQKTSNVDLLKLEDYPEHTKQIEEIKSEPTSQSAVDSKPRRRGRPRKSSGTIAITPSGHQRGRSRRVQKTPNVDLPKLEDYPEHTKQIEEIKCESTLSQSVLDSTPRKRGRPRKNVASVITTPSCRPPEITKIRKVVPKLEVNSKCAELRAELKMLKVSLQETEQDIKRLKKLNAKLEILVKEREEKNSSGFEKPNWSSNLDWKQFELQFRF